ncbi:hypothetical protein TNCV_4987561 [Trichonephila clavipes]|nr:hypothetical protein TNCV_4987561 [Trichonephila clavipes]
MPRSCFLLSETFKHDEKGLSCKGLLKSHYNKIPITRPHPCRLINLTNRPVQISAFFAQENGEDVNVEDAAHTHEISYLEGLNTVETHLQNFEQQGASVMDLLFLRRRCDGIANRRGTIESYAFL